MAYKRMTLGDHFQLPGKAGVQERTPAPKALSSLLLGLHVLLIVHFIMSQQQLSVDEWFSIFSLAFISHESPLQQQQPVWPHGSS
jgi:hypothetical protein